jgi:hypothetical protein
MSASARFQVLAAVSERFGPAVEIQKYTNGHMTVVQPLRGKSGHVYAYMGTSISGKTWEELLASIERYDQREREDRARAWMAAAYRAAVEGYDVREPSKQLQAWIEGRVSE